ncbi:hypothetical protein HPB50_017743 [Hyalomma asiaticum]|uniref:Uncharacterized protein n=1 Tax=Hyalomma asiaticum TaxID=266040 RepID=A0ACB7SXF3_HYAAI|nr:hypothetical protein HPB50_017743 [Hyalomma asiaticum]
MLAHVVLDNLSAIELFFLSPNTTALVQLLYQGIIRSVKHLYKKNLLRRMIVTVECSEAYCINLLGAIHLLAYSWQQVESATVENCFSQAKFLVYVTTGKREECDDNCNSLLTEVLERQGSAEALQFESFRDLDSDVATSPDLTDSEIVAAFVPREFEDDENDDDDGYVIKVEPDQGPPLMAVDDAVAVTRAFAEKKGLMVRDDNFKVACDWTRAKFSPDASYVAVGSHDGTLFIWNTQTAKLEKKLKEMSSPIIACSWNPSGEYIASTDRDKRVCIWSQV